MKKHLKIALALMAVVAIYVAAYVSYSAHGFYQKGPRGYIGQVVWQPALGDSQVLQTLFAPLVSFDRRFVHRSYHTC
ncbi:MAG: hypothetical protein WD768_12295 [Phycisphaeraceae bacterium]